jgi:hypothetical protein
MTIMVDLHVLSISLSLFSLVCQLILLALFSQCLRSKLPFVCACSSYKPTVVPVLHPHSLSICPSAKSLFNCVQSDAIDFVRFIHILYSFLSSVNAIFRSFSSNNSSSNVCLDSIDPTKSSSSSSLSLSLSLYKSQPN